MKIIQKRIYGKYIREISLFLNFKRVNAILRYTTVSFYLALSI